MKIKQIIDKNAAVIRTIAGAAFVLLGLLRAYSVIVGGFTVSAGDFLSAAAALLMLAAGILGLIPRAARTAKAAGSALFGILALLFVLTIIDGGDFDLFLLAETALAWLLTVTVRVPDGK